MIVDFHAHILPCADHGSDSAETTAKQLQMIAAAGTEAVVATPHFYPNQDTVDSFLARREASAKALYDLQIPNAPQLFLGAEVLVCHGLSKMKGLERLAVVGTNVLLLEMPFRQWDSELLDTLEDIEELGLHPVLAHIDRYPRDGVEQLLRAGFDAQLNAEGFKGLFSPGRCRRYLDSGRVVALGSDLHGAVPGSYRDFVRACKKLGARAETVFERSAALLQKAAPITELFGEKPLTV